MTTVTLNRYLGGTTVFQTANLESVLAHALAANQTVVLANGLVYWVGFTGLVVADATAPSIRTLLWQYTTLPSLQFDPPVAFVQGQSQISLTDALIAAGAFIPPGQSLADTLSNNYIAVYNGVNPFEGPQGATGAVGATGPPPSTEEITASITSVLSSSVGTSVITPLVETSTTTWLVANEDALRSTVPPSDQQVETQVGVFINSSAGTQALVPLVDNSSTTWLTSNQDVLKSAVPGPEGQPGLPAPTLSSISVVDSDLLFLWSDGSSFVVPLDSAIGTAVAAYLQEHSGDITFSPVTCVTDLALSGNVLTLAKSDSTNASLTLPAPILTASLSGTVLILNTSSGIFSVDLASVGVSQSTLTQMNQKPWYYFSPKAGARQNFMYTSTLNNPSYTASNTWKVETWIRLRSAYLNGYGTLLDTRSYPGAGGSDWFIFLIWGGTNGNFPALWSSSGGKGVSFNSGPFLKTNDWSHVVWQSSPSTGLQFLVDGVLAQTLSGQTPTFGVASDFCFGNVVDQVSNVSNWVLRLDADVSQLMVRVGSTVDMYADGYTPPQSLSYVGQDKSDMVYIMPHGFKNMTLPANQVVEEFY